jgi:murein L,D-transpeptidase YcbB/YkuD
MNQRKEQEEQYNEYRKRLSNDIENLKKKNNELELGAKLKDGEYEKNVSLLEERLAEAEEVKETATR